MNIKTISAAIILSALSIGAIVQNGNAQTMKQPSAVTSSYKLSSVNAPTTGTLEIVGKADGTSVARLRNLKTEAGPDLHVYLYAASLPGKTAKDVKAVKYIDLGKLSAPFKGNFEYKIPAKTDLHQFKSLIIWCDVASVVFAGANLN